MEWEFSVVFCFEWKGRRGRVMGEYLGGRLLVGVVMFLGFSVVEGDSVVEWEGGERSW